MAKVGKKNSYRIINRALRGAKIKNLGVIAQDWGVTEGEDGRFCLISDCACPLGLVLIGKKCDLGLEASAARVLSQPIEWVASFIRGVDGDRPRADDYKAAYKFGQTIRAKYV